MRTIAIVNQKGGCGKTTTAINLAACLGRLGRRTLLVDMDPQGHCAAGLGVPEHRAELDTTDFLLSSGGGRGWWRAALNLDLIPSRVRLAGLDAPGSSFARRPDREHCLSRALKSAAGEFDVCLIDCPPAIGLLTFNALVAADLVLVPVETAYFSLQGAARQLQTVRAMSRRLQTPIKCAVLPTLHEPGLSVAEDLLEELKRRFGKRLLPVVVHRDPALREAASFGRPVCQHAPRSQAARDYAALASVLIESESLMPGASEEDWSDVEAAAEQSISRPASGEIPPDAAPGPGDAQPGPLSGGSWMISGAPLVLSTSGLGEVIVTISGTELLQPRRPVQASPAPEPAPSLTRHLPPTPSRAEELVRRAASVRAVEQAAPSAPPAPKPVPGCRVTPEGVEFVQPRAIGRRVAVAGSFSEWRPLEMRTDENAGAHLLRLPLPPGRHEYRLVVDGTWTADPYNTEWVLNEFGEAHSIVEVPGADRPSEDDDLRSGAD